MKIQIFLITIEPLQPNTNQPENINLNKNLKKATNISSKLSFIGKKLNRKNELVFATDVIEMRDFMGL